MSEYTTDKQFIDLSQIEFHGSILDVGGGGEGVISHHSGSSVIAIDRRKDELEETANIGVKIVMDACNMTFLDRTFDNVTSFYTIMYMSFESTNAVLKEAYRVLKPNGLLWIWDTRIPKLSYNDIFIVPLEVKIDTDKVISTGYGTRWSREQTEKSLVKHLADVGFIIKEQKIVDNCIYLCCCKQ